MRDSNPRPLARHPSAAQFSAYPCVSLSAVEQGFARRSVQRDSLRPPYGVHSVIIAPACLAASCGRRGERSVGEPHSSRSVAIVILPPPRFAAVRTTCQTVFISSNTVGKRPSSEMPFDTQPSLRHRPFFRSLSGSFSSARRWTARRGFTDAGGATTSSSSGHKPLDDRRFRGCNDPSGVLGGDGKRSEPTGRLEGRDR